MNKNQAILEEAIKGIFEGGGIPVEEDTDQLGFEIAEKVANVINKHIKSLTNKPQVAKELRKAVLRHLRENTLGINK